MRSINIWQPITLPDFVGDRIVQVCLVFVIVLLLLLFPNHLLSRGYFMFLCLCIVFKYKVLEKNCDIHALIGYFIIRTKNILQCSTQKIITSFARSLLCYVQIYSLGLHLITINFQLPVDLCLYKQSPHLLHERQIYHTLEL